MIAAKNIVRTAAPLKDVMMCMNVEGVGTKREQYRILRTIPKSSSVVVVGNVFSARSTKNTQKHTPLRDSKDV